MSKQETIADFGVRTFLPRWPKFYNFLGMILFLIVDAEKLNSALYFVAKKK